LLQIDHANALNIEKRNSVRALFVIPVFNDWTSLTMLLEGLDLALEDQGVRADVLVVDDASTIPMKNPLILEGFDAIEQVSVLQLKRNLGHQRAIAIGLAYVEAHYCGDMVVVMDSDGEDRPEDAVRLINASLVAEGRKIVFACRSQRSESWLFKLFYRIYRGTYRLLTGFDIQVGNFSVVPFGLLHRLVAVSEIWNHYAAGILKSKLPHTDVPTRRGYRYHGQSTMNFSSLVTHGLSAISVYGEIVGVRLLMASCVLIGVTIAGLFGVITIRLFTNLAIPGWTSYLVVALVSLILQAFIISLSFIFLVLTGRNSTSFLPNRDYHYFVLSLEKFFSNP
jgi:glycosyltransferase involved in cell wall biosynthesis